MAEPAVIAGKYRVVRRLGRGGMAEVFLARSEGPGGFSRQVVLKRLDAAIARDADAVTLFLDEARTASRLHHQHIAQVFDFGHDDDGYFLAMEYLDGADARTLVEAAAGGIAIPAAVAIASAAALGLHHAHELAVIHRDVTGGNVFVTFDGAVKLIDFGIARAADRTTRTRDGLVRGTVAYMSPEQVHGFVLDRRSDLFSLGVVLYELVTGRRPFDDPGNSDLVVMKRIEAGVHAPARATRRDLPGPLDDLIERLLEVDPALRPASGELLALALDAIARMPSPELGRYVRSLAPHATLVDAPAPDLSGVETETVSQRRRIDDGEPDAPAAEPTGRTMPGPPVRLAAPAARPRRRWPLAVGVGVAVASMGLVGGIAATGDSKHLAPADATAEPDASGPDQTPEAAPDAAVPDAGGIGAEGCLRLATVGIETTKVMLAQRTESAWSIRMMVVNVAAFLGLDRQPWTEGFLDSCDGIASLGEFAAAKRAYEMVERETVRYERDKKLVFTGTSSFGQLGYQDLDSGTIISEDEAKRR